MRYYIQECVNADSERAYYRQQFWSSDDEYFSPEDAVSKCSGDVCDRCLSDYAGLYVNESCGKRVLWTAESEARIIAREIKDFGDDPESLAEQLKIWEFDDAQIARILAEHGIPQEA